MKSINEIYFLFQKYFSKENIAYNSSKKVGFIFVFIEKVIKQK